MSNDNNLSLSPGNRHFLTFLPWWMWVILAIEVAAPILFATSTILDPATVVPGADKITPVIAMYVVRNYAVAFGLILALAFRRYTAVSLFVIVRMCMDISDIVNSYVFGASEGVLKMIPFLAILFIVLPTIGLLWLRKRVQAEGKLLGIHAD